MRNENGHEYSNMYLRPSQIRYAKYQRPTNARYVERIMRNFNGDIVNEPKISFRDGIYWCYDGAHTIAAWQNMFGDEPIRCKVFSGMTYEEEAERFAWQTGTGMGTAHAPTALETFRAEVEAKNAHALNIINGAEEAGYTIPYKKIKTPDHIVAIEALEYAYDTLGYKGYSEVLQVIRGAWPHDAMATNGFIISGMALFFKTYYGEFKIAELIKSMSRAGVTPASLINHARTIGTSTRRYLAKAILAKYNFKRTSGRLEDRL